jgi:hypothetical protein
VARIVTRRQQQFIEHIRRGRVCLDTGPEKGLPELVLSSYQRGLTRHILDHVFEYLPACAYRFALRASLHHFKECQFDCGPWHGDQDWSAVNVEY